MQITEQLETGKLYRWMRTDGWDWFGEQRWWEVDVVISGFNGSGGLWLTEYWHWNGSSQNMRVQIQTLSVEESQKVVLAIEEQLVDKADENGVNNG